MPILVRKTLDIVRSSLAHSGWSGPTIWDNMLTIKKAAALTGVSEHTLRAWERRYGVLEPIRTDAGYRLYDQAELARIEAMQGLVQAGWTPRAAAAEVTRSGVVGIADPYAELVRAAAAMAASTVHDLISAAFARAPFEAVVDHWLMPALVRVGKAWAKGEVSVAGEHLVANAVTLHLSAAYESAGTGQRGRPVLIGAPPKVDHQLGLLAFAVAARRAGLPTVYLGAQVPLEAWVDAAEKSGARAAVTSVPRRRDASRAVKVVEVLGVLPVPVWIGGRYQHLVGEPAQRLGDAIGPAAARLAEAVDE